MTTFRRAGVENIAHLRPRPHFQFVREDIRNAQVLDRLTSESDVVIHLAAAVGVELIVDDPVRTIRTNIIGTEGGARGREPVRLQGADRLHL